MKEIFERLKKISHAINEEYYNLEFYSDKRMTNSKYYKAALEQISEYILIEQLICNEITYDMIFELITLILESPITNADLNRCFNILYERYVELLCLECGKGNQIDIKEELSYLNAEEEFDSLYDLDSYLIDYDVEEYRNLDLVMTEIYIKAIKKMDELLRITPANNEKERELANSLKKSFLITKFSYFRINGTFEKAAVLFDFDIHNFQKIFEITIDAEIDAENMYYNEALKMIRIIHTIPKESNDPEDINDALFFTLCFEELISNLDKDKLMRIKEFIDHLELEDKNSFYIKNCLCKIKEKERELN